ncbi:MAG: HlyD family secretion protein [Tannerella sp.]|nr:HlyD family secretion protein [Tannerella sp.]
MRLLPSELVNNGIDAYLEKSAVKFHGIYWTLVLLVAVAGAALPFLYVDVSVQNTGIIRPLAEKTEIYASVSEWVDSVYVREGQKIRLGDTILTFLRSSPDFKISYQNKRLEDFREHLSDLRLLASDSKPASFRSPVRQQEYYLYLRQKTEYETNLEKTKLDYERNKRLFDKKVISAEEFEGYQHEYNKAGNALESFVNNQAAKWQSDLNDYNNMYAEMTSSIQQSEKEKDNYVVISPVSGTIDQFSGIYKGSSIQAGAPLAMISPDSSLLAEIYVSPRNIGYLAIGMPVNIQVSSFNYNEWGILQGKVTDISSDFMTDNSGNNAFYKVKCRFDRDFLERKNGIKGYLKKGMTVSAHFIITKRSLFDLLYQKIDDWVNPAQYEGS